MAAEVDKIVAKRRKQQKSGREYSFNAAMKEALQMYIDSEKSKTKVKAKKPVPVEVKA
jgi:hypothetical protein